MKSVLIPLVMALVAASPAHADISDSSEYGFTVRYKVTVNAPPEQVWSHLLDIAGWWDGNHSWSGSASNFTLDAHPGGCWCEKLPGGGVVHQTVVYVDANKLLRLNGALGPMQGMGLTGVSTFALSPKDKGTLLDVSYIASGYRPGGLTAFAPTVDAVLGIQVKRLKAFAETGNPVVQGPPTN
jgi:uncharacterized protein YndB with AHSA1/START domain